MKVQILVFISITFIVKMYAQSTVTDIDGNIYDTISIGKQVWMKQNLKTTHYSNGLALVDGTNIGNILATDTTKYYFDSGDSPVYTAIYGKLYTWVAIMNNTINNSVKLSNVQGVCPSGWHVPSDSEWTVLTDYLGGEISAGGKMKEAGTLHWNNPNTGADNSSGFSALPAGNRYPGGSLLFFGIGSYGRWWSSTNCTSNDICCRVLSCGTDVVARYYYTKSYGFSVRCVRDLPTIAETMNNNFQVSIFPNPTNGSIAITLGLQNYEIFKCKIYNFLGYCVIERILLNGTNYIDLSNLSNGIYFVNISTISGIIFQQKLIKD